MLIDDIYSGGTPDDGDYMLLSQAMTEGLFHPRCRHGLGTHYPELEDIVHYDTEENRVNEYGTEKLNQAHIENMIQKYKRLVTGSIDPTNIAKYQARLDEWESKKAQLSVANSENQEAIFERNNRFSFDENSNFDNGNVLVEDNIKDDNRSGSDLFPKKKQKEIYQTERIISGNRYETAVVYNSDGTIFFKKKGDFDAVKFTKSQLPKLNGKIVTHNHPSNSGFSTDDITFMQKYKLSEMRSCNMFGTHILRPTEKSITVSYNELDKRLNELYNEFADKYRDIAAQNGKSIIQYLQNIEIVVMKTVSKEYNFYYEWKPIK